jgi:hypothetical protein
MSWSNDYKKSIDCGNPKGFSQKAHCAARRKRKRGEETKSKSPFSEQKEMSETRYCKLCRKIEQRDGCSYGPLMWDRYSTPILTMNQIKYDRNRPHPANESKDHEYSMARSELSTIAKATKKLQKKMKKGEGEIEAWVQSKITKAADYIDTAADYVDSGEMNKEEVEILEGKRDGKSAKDKDYSLRDWFKGGGWVQAGGKYDGKPCAKQPGQKTKPFCRDADDRASMSKEERNKRAAKKRKEDPNPNRKGKAKFVTVEQVDASKYGKTPDQILQDIIDKDKKGPNKYGGGQVIKTGLQKAHFEPEGEQLDELWGKVAIGAGAAFIPYLLKKFAKPAVDKAIDSPATGSDDLIDKMKQKRDAINKATQKNSYEPEGDMVEEKDACYKKVKARYDVWPSAYASGALVKCRKVGAKNWGNKTKKEGYEFSNWRDEFFPTEVESVNIIEPQPLQPSKGIGSEILDEAGKKCWKGYKKSGTQELFGKTYNRCVKEGYSDWRTEISEDWQSVNRKDKTDGLSQAAVDAYRRENPGSKLQTAVTEKKPKGKRAKRRANFCRRMKGMKSKLTSSKTARDPDSRINKALRRWRCR